VAIEFTDIDAGSARQCEGSLGAGISLSALVVGGDMQCRGEAVGRQK